MEAKKQTAMELAKDLVTLGIHNVPQVARTYVRQHGNLSLFDAYVHYAILIEGLSSEGYGTPLDKAAYDWFKPNPKTAEQRGLELATGCETDVPKLAHDYYLEISSGYQKTDEVRHACYTRYAMIVEELKSENHSYVPSPETVKWFKDRMPKPQPTSLDGDYERLNNLYRAVESRLLAMNLSIEVWTNATVGVYGVPTDCLIGTTAAGIYYAGPKVPVRDAKPILECSAAVRLAMVDDLPALVEAAKQAAGGQAKEIRQACDKLARLVESMDGTVKAE